MKASVLRALLYSLIALASSAAAAYPDGRIRLIISSAAGRLARHRLAHSRGRAGQADGPADHHRQPARRRADDRHRDHRARQPDGYTLGYANVVTLAINKRCCRSSRTIPTGTSRWSGSSSTYNLLAVTNSLPVKSVRELIDYARQNPGKLLNASSGNGTTGHLGGELFKIMTGTQIVHVPYKGSPQGITDLIAGQVQLMFDNLTSISPHVKSGRVRGLGVSSLKRSPIFPDIPTISEAGVPGYETNRGVASWCRSGTPRAIVDEAQHRNEQGAAVAELKERYAAIEAEPVGGTPESSLRS